MTGRTAPRSSPSGSVEDLKTAAKSAEEKTNRPARHGGDASADFVRDIAEAPPPKDIKTVKAASDAREAEPRSKA